MNIPYGRWQPGAVARVTVPATAGGIDLSPATDPKMAWLKIIKNPTGAAAPIEITLDGTAPVFGAGFSIPPGESWPFPTHQRIRAICASGTVGVQVIVGPIRG